MTWRCAGCGYGGNLGHSGWQYCAACGAAKPAPKPDVKPKPTMK